MVVITDITMSPYNQVVALGVAILSVMNITTPIDSNNQHGNSNGSSWSWWVFMDTSVCCGSRVVAGGAAAADRQLHRSLAGSTLRQI